jgi:hypothetical protein
LVSAFLNLPKTLASSFTSPFLDASSIGCLGFRLALKSFLGGVRDLGFSDGSGRASPVRPASDGLRKADAGASSTLLGASLAGAGSSLVGMTSSAGLSLGEGSTRCSNSGGTSFFVVSNLRGLKGLVTFSRSETDSFLGMSNLRRLAGFSWTSLIGDVRPEPNGSAEGPPLPRSTLLRCCLMRLISAIHAGCAGGGCLSFGESGLLSALSNQLDLVGLHRFEGEGGDVSSCGSSFAWNDDATDLLRL